MANKNIAVFFDFDGTIYNGVVAFDFLKFALKNKVIRFSEIMALSRFIYYYFLDKFNLVERHSINSKIYQLIKGWNSKDLEKASEKFFSQKARKKFYPKIVEILIWHKKKGHKIIIVTSALKEIIIPAKELLKADDVLATEVEKKNGVYTGIIKELPIGKNRKQAIMSYCKKHSIDLSNSCAYSDHFSDIHMLETVGNPIATGPDDKLRKYALKRKWKIIDH